MDPRIIRSKLDHIRRQATLAVWPIDPWQVRTAEHLAPGQYRYDGDWTEVTGETSWPAAKTLFLRTQAQAPQGVPAKDLYISFDAEGLEGLLSIDGQPYAGIDGNHPRVVLPHTGALTLEAEFMCLPASLHTPALRREKARLRQVAFVQVDRDVEAAYYDLWFTWEAAQAVRDERRRVLLEAALEDALLAIDLTAPREQFRQEVADARRLLQERIAAIAPDPEAGSVFLTGHSHIDTAWLWPLRETIRKCGRTFSTACRLLERYPDYHFSCSQPQLYAYTKEHYPGLYEEIRRWVQTGRWACSGGMWVEPDCNVPSGESLIRQNLLGIRFFEREFGVRVRTCWLPDVFGYPASLPQILKGCGIEQFYTNKLHWQAHNPFPMNLFWWEGIDGTRLLAHIPRLKRGYNGWPTPEELCVAWENYQQKAAYPELLFPFGFGDGGGGVTEEMLEFAARAERFPGLPASRQGAEEAYFDAVRAADPSLPVWSGELYLETHRGTYTSQGAIKRANRRNELLLREAEILSSLANAQALSASDHESRGPEGAGIDITPLQGAWQNLLLLQFHDILPGSSIGEVYREAAADHARIEAAAQSVRAAALQALTPAADVVAFNSLSWPRDDVAVATIPAMEGPLELVSSEGEAVAAQIIARRGDQVDIAFAPGALPALGYAGFSIRPAAQPAEHSLRATPGEMENRYFRLRLAEDGTIAGLYDKVHGREVLPKGECANRLQLFQDGPEREAAWNIHATFEKREYAWEPGTTIEVVECGPVRAVVRITRHFRQSRIEQDLILYDQLPRIDFVTRAHWEERQVMLKAAFPLAVRSSRAAFEVQFGAVERPTHRNTSWDQEKFEVCAHRWADLSEAGYGVSLLNDCKYGHDVHGHTLRLTLLRGPEWPDPDADRGEHTFTYALYPHAGSWAEGGTVQRGWELNVPILCLAGGGQAAADTGTRSFFAVDGPAVLETLKQAEDGGGPWTREPLQQHARDMGWIVRFYEPYGGRGTVRVRTPWPLQRVCECNLVEEAQSEVAPQGDAFAFAMRPFEIKTFRLYPAK